MATSRETSETDALLAPPTPTVVSVPIADTGEYKNNNLSSGQNAVDSAAPRRFPALARTASALRSPSSILRSPMPRFTLDGPRLSSWRVNSRNATPQFGPMESHAREQYQTYGVQRTHSFPSDLYSGARFSRFEIEEALRQRNGSTLMDWLKSKGRNPFYAAMRKQQQKESDIEKRAKAQHRESFNYDFFESRVNMQHDQEQTESAIRSLNIARWVMTFGVGLGTALVACFVEFWTSLLSTFRTFTLNSLVADERNGIRTFGFGYFVYTLISVAFVAVASYCVAILCPVAGGSGISEIKATLNGIKIHRVVRLKTLFCKAFGILFSVAGGLPVGKEGPMIHSGSVIGAGLSQGKSSSFGLDTSWTKFKGFRNDKEKRDFISCGAAAGVAAAFGAPIGGVLFALEEGASFWHQNLTWRTFFCAMVSAFVLNYFMSFMEASEASGPTPDVGHVSIGGTLGTQTGTFTFGQFTGSKAYEVVDVPVFIVMGMIGGLFGAGFNGANMVLTKFRKRYVTHRLLRFGEALLIAFCMATASFWLSYFFGTCRDLAGDYKDSLSQFYCPTGQYNDLASLFTVNYATSMKQLLHFTTASSFTAFSLCMFFVVFYIFACWTYGIAVPSGLFVPSLLAGAAYGRICVMIVHSLGFQVGAQDGMFALIGSACMLGGMARMTISLTVIILECTGVIEWGLPIMVSLMAARWVGNSFNEGLYDIHIHLNHLPFLEFDPPYYARFLRALNIMSSPTIGFPVILPRSQDAAGGGQRLNLGDKRKSPRFSGIIYRHHLAVLLQRKDFFIEKPEPFVRTPASDTTLLYNDQYALSYRDMEGSYPRYPSINDIQLDDDERDLWMDLTPYMNPTPHTVQEQTPVPRAFRLFRSLGLRHLIVLNRRNEVRGVITRKDLTPAHLKFCLESLNETEKQRIQGYFHRDRAGSERFEDVEKKLIRINDNS
ncbi:chloride channel family [Plasmopara halstedii]|uniref:Chloride channel protein n=1 Tax=Plasmopara halstedii TaxID=4781 RepID=A0A0P1A865_PLAHL|nr:chloride channel family [Plasmopara halstedii]CEG36884.1 chloride channel family [Plasmopara halstedii]|eukprot:XP_024573253.1 chloride channel family [Plasmopara halstedii]